MVLFRLQPSLLFRTDTSSSNWTWTLVSSTILMMTYHRFQFPRPRCVLTEIYTNPVNERDVKSVQLKKCLTKGVAIISRVFLSLVYCINTVNPLYYLYSVSLPVYVRVIIVSYNRMGSWRLSQNLSYNSKYIESKKMDIFNGI